VHTGHFIDIAWPNCMWAVGVCACIAPRTLCDMKVYCIHLQNDLSRVKWDVKLYNSTLLY